MVKERWGNDMIYTIQKGDTLSELAKRFNTSVDSLVKANNIKDPNKIYAGHTLTVPVAGSILDAIKRIIGWPR